LDIEPLVSIIIVNYNGKTNLENCLSSLSESSYKKLEIILVDNNSQDDSVDYVKNKHPKVHIIKLDKNFGFAYPNNLGAKNANGNLLLFLNNDTKPSPQFVTELVNVLNDPTIGICQSLLLKPTGEVDSSGDYVDTKGIAYSSQQRVEKTSEILSAKGASMMIRKDLFEKMGGFDEKFFVTFEDIDLGWRTWISGYKVVVVPKSVVYHIGGQTINKMMLEISFHGFKNQLSMKITNFEGVNVIKCLVLFFAIYGIRELRILFDYKLHGSTKITATKYEEKIAQKPDLKIILKAIAWCFCNLGYLSKKRRQVNSSRVNSTGDLVKLGVIKK
jgi:GT2 family glycosyltransferase